MITVPTFIEEQIHKHLTLASNFRTQRNSYFPVFRLAPELLANIFILGVQDYYHENDDHLTFRVPSWVNVSYVCHHWRNVALNCPTLWTYHFTVSLPWTEELLVRSRQASLKIRIHFDSRKTCSWWSSLVEKLLSHTERIQELRLRVPTSVLPSVFFLHAPRLQILDIEGDDHEDLHSEWTPTIDEGHIPRLCTLKLNKFPLLWQSLNLSRITTFFLCRLPVHYQHDILDFLATLSRMQALEVLHLDHALASARDLLSSGALDAYSINLPYLTRLLIAAPVSTVVAFLSCVDIPSKTEVRLEIGEDGPSIDDFARLPTALARRFSPSKDSSSFSPAIRSMAVRFPWPTFALCASEHDACDVDLSIDSEDEDEDNLPPLDCHISLVLLIEMKPWLMIRDRNMSIIHNICCAVPFTRSIQTLRVVNPPFEFDFWRQMLPHLRGLWHMILSDSFMPNMAALLAADEPVAVTTKKTGDPLSLGPKFVPALEELTLHRMMFISEAGLLTDAITCKSLRDALSTRKGPKLRLTMIECNTEAENPLVT